ncbi:pyruvate, phosphate dikinase [Facklamia hominis]|uniref:Pyruvate, phosphate dikinase n=1 Tax=Facklamia hominis CCUG 36813 TaxID=883111 RepID=K1LEC7_9LACT|nr:pyruvate, phosphate dikinase [Facklamia hominis]EKB54990.1 pyruvate, phosphate dikinase [Facklamia hominis CCUG 36813]
MRRIYAFNEGHADMKDLLGGKGANLAEMTHLGLPVPQGFTITTQACLEFLESNNTLLDELKEEISLAVAQLEDKTGKKFNDAKNLLLVSVRSGAKFSMPGMMDTILNLGLNDQNVEKLAKLTNNQRFAYDCYRRLLQMFANVVYEIDMKHFDRILEQKKKEKHIQYDYDLSADDLQSIIIDYKKVYQQELGFEFPQNVFDQIHEAVKAVFKSWNNHRAIVYRKLNHIPDDLGTAVNIQEMVFGNMSENSGTGVLFTRNPANGEANLYGEYLTNAQGEDVVAGIRTPASINRLKDQFPSIYQEILQYTQKLEKHYHDMQDMEFTIENGRLFILQTRNGKRTAQAAVKIAVDLVQEGILTPQQALLTIDCQSLNTLLHPAFDPSSLEQASLISSMGLPASPGAATGEIVFTADRAKELADQGHSVILVRHETSPEDIVGMHSSKAIVTSQGGMTSHAAVVARGMGKCCVAGCNELEINEDKKTLTYPGGQLNEGDIISADGSTGKLYLGEIKTIATGKNDYFDQVMEWARQYADMEVRMNAETVNDIKTGLQFKANGIGLVRTEHMFFEAQRLIAIRQFLLAKDEPARQTALETIRHFQTEDFSNIFDLMQDKAVVIRLLDAPLHEFLPHSHHEIQQVAQDLHLDADELFDRVQAMKEVNPMMGHRGCRMGMTHPGLYIAQSEAIIRAAIKTAQAGHEVKAEIMIPLVSTQGELKSLKEKIKEHLDQILNQEKISVDYMIGVMIETPRACFIADKLAEDACFFSFGTNDLTQLSFGYSRDDAGKFLNQYMDQGILEHDPFQTIDTSAVKELIALATQKGRSIKDQLKVGVCGELGGDPKSIESFHEIGLSYVSCSPYRVPIAQLAVAQSSIRHQEK